MKVIRLRQARNKHVSAYFLSPGYYRLPDITEAREVPFVLHRLLASAIYKRAITFGKFLKNNLVGVYHNILYCDIIGA